MLKITPKEVSLIFGMPLDGEELFPIPASSKASAMESFSDFLIYNFKKENVISRKTVTSKLNSMIKQKKGDKNLIKLLVLLLVITFLFPNNQSYLPWGFLGKLLNLKKMNSISWPRAICQNILKNVKTYHADPRNTPGCTMVLLVCIYNIHLIQTH